ncbi:MAG TPA: LuxR C-terminal-related transcriptional regulator [Polyangia bacterium]|nr:LuxR C-terminal-related transcriptional regulator [Polyangia bacterium]
MKQARGARGAIETVLGLISRPALLIDRGGRIRLANLPGARLLGSNRAHIQGALQLAARGDRSARAWRLTPVGGAPRTSGFIAVLDPTDDPTPPAAGRVAVAERWQLTARQAAVLALVADGATNAAVAEALGIKQRTVEFHLSVIFDKAGVDNRATLIAKLLTP